MMPLNTRLLSCCCVPLFATLLLSFINPGKVTFRAWQDTIQSRSDSLLMVKDYLLQIKSAIPADSSEVKQKITQLQQLVRQGSYQQKVLERQIIALPGHHAEALKDMVQQFRFIVQSAALLRSDLQQSVFSSASVQQEVRYLQRHIPPLIHQLYAYAKKPAGGS